MTVAYSSIIEALLKWNSGTQVDNTRQWLPGKPVKLFSGFTRFKFIYGITWSGNIVAKYHNRTAIITLTRILSVLLGTMFSIVPDSLISVLQADLPFCAWNSMSFGILCICNNSKIAVDHNRVLCSVCLPPSWIFRNNLIWNTELITHSLNQLESLWGVFMRYSSFYLIPERQTLVHNLSLVCTNRQIFRLTQDANMPSVSSQIISQQIMRYIRKYFH